MTNPCRNDQSDAYTVLHAVPSINTRALYANALNSIARKGVQRVEDPLAGSRGSALRFPNQHAGAVCKCAQLNRAKGSPEGRRPFGGVKGQRPLGFPNQHAGAVCSCAQLNREKGSPEGRRPFGGVKGQRPWGPQSTRGRCMQSRSTQSRKRESRGSKTLWRGQGAAPLGFPGKELL